MAGRGGRGQPVMAATAGAAGQALGGQALGGRVAGMVLSRVGRPSYQEREAMTSRQPGVTPPGEGGERGEGASMESALTAQDWLMRLLPLVLLIVAGLAGLRGAAGTPRWDGPLHQDALVVGVALEVVIVILFVILLLRRRRGSQEATAVKLRGVLMTVLGAGAVGAVVLTLFGLHLHISGQERRPPPAGQHPTAIPSSLRPRSGSGLAPHFPMT